MDARTKPETPQLPLTQFVTYRMARVQAKLNAQAMRLLRETSGIGLSQWRILAMLGTEGGPVRTSELRRWMQFDKGLLSRTVKGLIADGLVIAAEDMQDQRMQRVMLTDAGRAIFEQTLPAMRQRQAKLTSGLTADELSTLFNALEKLEALAEDVDGDH